MHRSKWLLEPGRGRGTPPHDTCPSSSAHWHGRGTWPCTVHTHVSYWHGVDAGSVAAGQPRPWFPPQSSSEKRGSCPSHKPHTAGPARAGHLDQGLHNRSGPHIDLRRTGTPPPHRGQPARRADRARRSIRHQMPRTNNLRLPGTQRTIVNDSCGYQRVQQLPEQLAGQPDQHATARRRVDAAPTLAHSIEQYTRRGSPSWGMGPRHSGQRGAGVRSTTAGRAMVAA